ncbi:50S ribosomal protein L22 [bacterium]|nr:50S ribosomal protein L22 [bacterium]
MQARAIKKYIPGSPRKMRLLADLIRGKSVEEALDILHFSPKQASKVCETTLRSAVSNLINAKDGGRVNPENVIITTITVDGGPVMKRILPAPQGRAFRIRKRSNHLTIVVSEQE